MKQLVISKQGLQELQVMDLLIIPKGELQQLLDEAAEKGAARALARKTTPPATGPVEWLTKEQALKMIHATRHTLDRLVHRGVIRKNDYTRNNSRKFYWRSDLLRYLEHGDKPLPPSELQKKLSKP